MSAHGQQHEQEHAAYAHDAHDAHDADMLRAKQMTLIERLNFQHRNSVEAQRQRMLERLRQYPTSANQARDLGITSPAARVNELRHKHGYNIKTVWIKRPTSDGKLRSVALYQLQSE